MDKHIVICGFSRAGTTMFYNMLRNTVSNFKFFDRECRALDLIDHPGNIVTKRPLDSQEIEQIKKTSKKEVHFIFCIRDPRALITSYHKRVPDDYFMSYDRMYFIPEGSPPTMTKPGVRPTYDAYVKVRDQVTTVRYEDIVTDPNAVQTMLSDTFGFEFDEPISNYGENQDIPERLQIALNGVRPIDKSRLDAWKLHPERIKEQFENNREFFDVLVDLGYEESDEWFRKWFNKY